MILWTIQTEGFLKKLERDGSIMIDGSDFVDEDYLFGYQWMAGQMNKRIGKPPKKNIFPLWAWYQWEGTERKRPDLRSKGHLPKGERGVRIEFECSKDKVLLSDFDLWHHVLNYFYLPESKEDHDKFDLMFRDAKSFNRKKFDEMVVKSWDRIFDLNLDDPYITGPIAEKSIQATLWELSINQLMDCKHFTAR